MKMKWLRDFLPKTRTENNSTNPTRSGSDDENRKGEDQVRDAARSEVHAAQEASNQIGDLVQRPPMVVDDDIEPVTTKIPKIDRQRQALSKSTALCFFCLEPLEADQPGGLNPRHVADQVPYGQCREALTRPKFEREQIWNGEPLVDETEFPLKNQDYRVPHYTDEQKHQMIENYIKRLSEPRDDEPLIIKNGRIVRFKHDHDGD